MNLFSKFAMIAALAAVLPACSVKTGTDAYDPGVKLDGTLGSPNGPLDLMINGSYVMGKPRYLVAYKKNFGYSLRFVSSISSQRLYLICDSSYGAYNEDELMGTIQIPDRYGMISAPSGESSVYVNLSRYSYYDKFAGTINVTSNDGYYISGELNLSGDSTLGTTHWTGAFTAKICN